MPSLQSPEITPTTEAPAESTSNKASAKRPSADSYLAGALPAWTDNAVLIYGPRKAGTTLLTNLLDGGEEIVVKPGETKLKLIAQYSSGDHFLTEYLESLRSPEFSPGELRPWPRATFEENIFAIYQGIKEKPKRPKMWAMKEVGGHLGSVLRVFYSHFPNGKVIMITRNPKQITRSVLNERRRRGVRLSFRQILNEVVDPLRVLKKQDKHRGKDRIHFVSYEDLVGVGTKENMENITKFLGVKYSQIFERPTIFGAPVVVQTSSRNTTQVFSSRQSWSQGLTLRERICVYVVHLFRRWIV